MKIKDTLDLCGWELWNFCIQNHQNLEGLLDLGAGRKVFYTGNDQGKNGREVIYDGSKWKVSAYMSDVDELRGLITALENATDEEIEALKGRATTLEGRVDTIDNMLNVENSQTVVDTWEEVKKFLASVSEETDLITLLNGKANWSADIAIDDIKTLGYGKNSGTTGWIYNGPAISFGANTTYFAQLQVNFQKDNLVFRRHTNEGFSDWREVLHQGNYVDLIGNTYLKTTGGVIEGNSDAFVVRRNSNGASWVTFENRDSEGKAKRIGFLGMSSPDVPSFMNGAANRVVKLLHEDNYSDLITTLNNNLNVPSITIGGIRLSVENGLLKIEGSAFATGELAAGGAGTEGNGGAGGFSLYESWGTSAPTEPLALGANLGYELKTRVEDLELAKTKVEISDTLVSGKPIGAITIDGNKTNLFAPATYAWSEITSKPTTIAGYGITDAVKVDGSTPLVGSLTISSASDKKIVLNNTDTDDKYQFISFCQNGVEYGSLGTTGDDKLKWNGNLVLHSGNVGEYALKTDGSNEMGAGKYINWEGSNLNGEDYESFGYGIRILTYDTASKNYRGGLSVGTRYGFQLTRQSNNNANFFTVRFNDVSNNNAWGDWKTIAFTDSDISGNAATATKLKNFVLLWGNEFDGTQSLDKSIIFAHGGAYLRGRTSEGGIFTFARVNEANELLLGQGTAQLSATTLIYGNRIRFCYGSAGSSAQTAITITEEGRVLINSSSAKLDRRLSIGDGGVYVSAISNASPALGSVGSNSLLVGTSTYGMQHWVLGNGQGNIQAGRFDGNATAYALNLNPLGGAVNIASANASTNVLGHLFASKDLYMNGFLMMNHGKEGIYMTGISLNWHNTNDEWSASLLAFTKDSFTIYPTLYANGLANFSSRVLIGNGTDDGSTNLQVNGTSTFNGASNFYGSTVFGKENLTMQVNFKCPVVAEDRVTIGGATLRWDDEIKALRLNTSLAATGELSAGGAGTEGGNTGGGGTGTIASPFSRTFTPNEKTSFTFSHDLPYYDVVVQVYEWDNSGMCWNMVLADIEIQNNDVTVTLGRKENVEHKIVVR